MKYPSLRTPHTLLVGMLLALAAACASGVGAARTRESLPREIFVSLTQVPDRTPDRWRGMSNLFMDSLPPATTDSVRTPSEWTSMKLTDIVSNAGLRSIRVLRFTTNGNPQPQYAVDTVGDLDFTHAPVLTFERYKNILVANIELTIRATSGNERRVPYQVLVSDDGYTYARIADFRTGTIRVDGRDFAVRVRNLTRGHPFYAPNAGTEFMVDLNGDGQFAERATVTVEGRPVAAEQVLAETPFMLAGRMFEVADIDSAGFRLRIRPSTREVAVAENRRAPEFVANQLPTGVFRLSQQVGKVVLIEFWATDCKYSEQVRVAANELVAKYGSKYIWVAVAKDTGRSDIEMHLAKYPMHAIVTMPDSAAWATYDPAGATPTFVVVDQRGIVRFRAEGASSIGAVTAKLDELFASPRQTPPPGPASDSASVHLVLRAVLEKLAPWSATAALSAESAAWDVVTPTDGGPLWLRAHQWLEVLLRARPGLPAESPLHFIRISEAVIRGDSLIAKFGIGSSWPDAHRSPSTFYEVRAKWIGMGWSTPQTRPVLFVD